MDLKELRSFLASKSAQLDEERSALKRQPLFRHETRLKEILQSETKKDGIDKNANIAVEEAPDIANAILDRISALETFKDDICPQANVNTSRTNRNSVHSLSFPDELVQSTNQSISPSHDGKCDVAHIPLNDAQESKQGNIEKETLASHAAPCVQNLKSGKNIKIPNQNLHWTPFLSREQEVEKLQEKFSSVSFWDDFGRSATAKKWKPETSESMVRIGEFSPANPDLQAPGKTLLGLGEYEDRRRQLLEKRKQEYKDYLSQNRNYVQRTDHFLHPSVKSSLDVSPLHTIKSSKVDDLGPSVNLMDAATQTDSWLVEPSQNEMHAMPGLQNYQSLTPGDTSLQSLSPREKLNMELQHHCAPCFVPRAHASQTAEQLPDARTRQLQLQEELRMQIEEKKRLEAERREQERREEEALQRRVAEQQARLQAEYEREEKLRLEREIQKQQQIEEFQRRQEELKAEAEALKLAGRRQKLQVVDTYSNEQEERKETAGGKNAHLVPPSEPAPVSIIKCVSPPLRSPRRANHNPQLADDPPSPRALIKVLEGPTLPRRHIQLEDSLPIPLMPVNSHTQSVSSYRSKRSPNISPRRSPHEPLKKSPSHSPSRFINPDSSIPIPTHRHSTIPSDAMRNLEERWKVPAVQRNVCVRGKTNTQNSTGNVLTQLGAFRHQLQMEHMKMEEKVKANYHPPQYHQKYYQQHMPHRSRRTD